SSSVILIVDGNDFLRAGAHAPDRLLAETLVHFLVGGRVEPVVVQLIDFGRDGGAASVAHATFYIDSNFDRHAFSSSRATAWASLPPTISTASPTIVSISSRTVGILLMIPCT